MNLSIVIPVRDEAPNIVPLLKELRAAMTGVANWEVLVVDDGSRDDTALRVAALAGADYPELHLLCHAANCGQSAGLRTGALAAKGEWLATLDGDGQNEPADLARLWTACLDARDPASLWIGHRVTRRDSGLRRISSRVANAVRSRLLNDGVPDTGCGLKLLRRDVFLTLPYFDHMHRFLPALVRREGLAVRSVPVGHRPRMAGHSKYGVNNRLWVGIVDLFGVLWLLRRRRLTVLVPAPAPRPSGVLEDRGADVRTLAASGVAE